MDYNVGQDLRVSFDVSKRVRVAITTQTKPSVECWVAFGARTVIFFVTREHYYVHCEACNFCSLPLLSSENLYFILRFRCYLGHVIVWRLYTNVERFAKTQKRN